MIFRERWNVKRERGHKKCVMSPHSGNDKIWHFASLFTSEIENITVDANGMTRCPPGLNIPVYVAPTTPTTTPAPPITGAPGMTGATGPMVSYQYLRQMLD